MVAEDRIPASAGRVLDGYDVGRGFGDACPSCGREYAPGDRLVVRIERSSEAAGWDVPSVVCAGCGRRSFTEDERRAGAEQILVSIEAVPAPMALVLDAESARLIDRSPKADA
ncbi:hypothetical protein [Natronomonas marina]|jgi:hypothetical protein|uniref:hypothetical protein n=1 Tax=Natronomonas marina TaxID=2961939 RepID=UPI0020CA10E3|nr:hypothetical protein [Natronomonas marina]